MACPHVESITLRPPSVNQSVYREDCTQCFDSIDDPSGLDVCLQCFNGGCTGERNHARLHHTLWNHPLALNIRRTRKVVVRDEPPPKISKLAIAAETEEDRYDTNITVKCLACGLDGLQSSGNPSLEATVQGILKANTFARKEEVKAWEQELTSCEHILTLQQGPPRKIESQDLGHCSRCDLKENLWLCLECGNLGCGRAQFGGVGGNSHALAHATETKHGVAVKLGSITPEGTADVYCYSCDEERVDDDLAAHLAHWGIILSERQKTEKSLTEMQIEQNLRWEFSMTTDDGKELKPLFGPGLTGLKNLGNSCYLASIVQCLFDLPSFQERYFRLDQDLPVVPEPALDLETQLRKLADGLLSGRYSKPDSDVVASEDAAEVPHQKGLAPAMFKHLVGRGHAEFSTMRQQDAFEFLQYLVERIGSSTHPEGAGGGGGGDPTAPFRFAMEQRLQCLSCRKVRYSTTEQDSIFIDVPLEKLPAEGDEEPKYKPVTLQSCLDALTGEEVVDLTCGACQSRDGYTKRTLFKTFPEVLVVNARKMAIVNWVPVKVDVPVIVDDAPFALDDYLSQGVQPGEELLPEDEAAATATTTPTFVPNPEALAQLQEMGFPQVRAEKALHATGNGSADAAMNWLFEHMEDPDIDTPVQLAAPGGSRTTDLADPGKIATLGDMGFAAPAAKKALRENGGDVERALEWLFTHAEDPSIYVEEEEEEQQQQQQQQPAPKAGDSKATVLAGSSEVPALFRLQSIVCHKGTSIHAGHYVAFIRKHLGKGEDAENWVLFNDEKVVKVVDVEEMKKFAYVYFFRRVPK
ncbi:hypothetical protein VTK73DRAFT_167 [Phialemonium thermophilum]|uniref:Ubiquitin carboxyl-terminal hydrolase n=1 Tax=Phialemonium thermophilum TaxID=223376 RepID=A0ABR3VWK4_9PEZI